MALTKPILNSVTSWDVTKGQTFTFSAIGGDQVVGNTLTIRNNATNNVVYTNTVTSFGLSNTVPADASGLANGVYYNAYITTKNSSGQTSVASNTIQFYCYSTPTLEFTNVNDGGSVDNSSFTFNIQYNQAQNEMIGNYTVNLYDLTQTLISTSGQLFAPGVVSIPTTLSYTLGGLSENSTYYISASCQTVHGATATTGLIQFTVIYESVDFYSSFTLTNNCTDGYISIDSSPVGIDGVASQNPPIFIGNRYVNLTNAGATVTYEEGYQISDNFTLKAWFKSPNIGWDLIKLTNELGQDIAIRLMHDYSNYDTQVFATLDVSNGYSIYTESINNATATQEYCIQARRIGNLYHIELEAITA